MSKWQCKPEQADEVRVGVVHMNESWAAAITAAVGPEFDELREALRRVCDARYIMSEIDDARLRIAIGKVNDIRNSIVGCQSVNFSEHVYPLVAALEDAGIEGVGYEKARENVGTMLERTNRAEAECERLRAEVKRLRDVPTDKKTTALARERANREGNRRAAAEQDAERLRARVAALETALRGTLAAWDQLGRAVLREAPGGVLLEDFGSHGPVLAAARALVDGTPQSEDECERLRGAVRRVLDSHLDWFRAKCRGVDCSAECGELDCAESAARALLDGGEGKP